MKMIEVNSLVKQYDRAKEPAVKGIDFTVNEGEFFAFLGPNGAGKTTTISILTTTLSKTKGEAKSQGLMWKHKRSRCGKMWALFFNSQALTHSSLRKKTSGFMPAYTVCTAIVQHLR